MPRRVLLSAASLLAFALVAPLAASSAWAAETPAPADAAAAPEGPNAVDKVVVTTAPYAVSLDTVTSSVNVVTDGIEAALAQAFDAANGADVRIAGAASTIQQYLHARLVDEMHFVITPILIGDGERLFDNLGGAIAGYECVSVTPSPSGVVHVRIARSPTGGG